jgi:hypothetical protein
MQWTTGRPFGHSRLLDRLLLRRAALRYAAHNWAVLPISDRSQLRLATGGSFDVIEVPAAIGLRALGAMRLRADVLGPDIADGRGPVAVGPTGRWMFFVRPGLPLRPELERRLDVVRHGPGSQVAAAPSHLPEGAVRWAVTPGKVRWRLPDAETVQARLADALAGLGHRPAEQPAAVPRQVSTTRRAG